MPLPGGSAGKAGVHYEDKWTAHCALDVLRGRASSIRIEPPGHEGDGIEFWIKRDDCIEYHQVKRQKESGEWTVAALREVLKNFEVRLRDPAARCVFVSMQSACSESSASMPAKQHLSMTSAKTTCMQSSEERHSRRFNSCGQNITNKPSWVC
jgi:hypothetical protein